jgi:hypothetical protein
LIGGAIHKNESLRIFYRNHMVSLFQSVHL